MRMLMVFLLKYIFKYKALFDLFALSPIFNLFKLYSVLDQLNADELINDIYQVSSYLIILL